MLVTDENGTGTPTTARETLRAAQSKFAAAKAATAAARESVARGENYLGGLDANQGGPNLAVLLAQLDGLAAGLSAAGEIDHDPERFWLASVRLFENFAGGICAELRANGANTEALETFITLGVSHARLKFETKWKELTASMPNVQGKAKN